MEMNLQTLYAELNHPADSQVSDLCVGQLEKQPGTPSSLVHQLLK